MVLLVDYRKKRADTGTDIDPTGHHHDGASRSHGPGNDHRVCQPSKCCHPHHGRTLQVTEAKILAAQLAAAQEEPDRQVLTAPSLRWSLKKSGPPGRSKAFGRCETSELVREHRNRRPTVLDEEMDMSTATLGSVSVIEPVPEEQESPRDRQLRQHAKKDWSQPSKRTEPSSSKPAAERKPRPGLLRSVSANHMPDASLKEVPEDAQKSVGERGCQSLSNLRDNLRESRDRLSFTLRRRKGRSKVMDESISSASRLGLEKNPSNRSLQSTHSLSVRPKSQLRVPAEGHRPSRPRSLSHTRRAKSTESGASVAAAADDGADIPTKIKLEKTKAKKGKTGEQPKTKGPKITSTGMSASERISRKKKGGHKVDATSLPRLEPMKTGLVEEDPPLVPPQEVPNTKPVNKGRRNGLGTTPKSQSFRMMSRVETMGNGVAEPPLPTPPIIIHVDNNCTNSLEALPGYSSDGDSIASASDLDLWGHDDDTDEEDSVERSYVPQLSPKPLPPRRTASLGVGNLSSTNDFCRSSSMRLMGLQGSFNLDGRRPSLSGSMSNSSMTNNSERSSKRSHKDLGYSFVTGSRIRVIDRKSQLLR